MHSMIEARGLGKHYGGTEAVAHVDLDVGAGSVLAVLGPNGAGKTTTVRMLTTLTRPDRGRARVAGRDVITEPAAVRRRIGVAAQDATLDEILTGRQNLVMVGELTGMARRHAKTRAAELLEQFELTDAGDRMVKGYSGGMRRRLDLAAALVTRPEVLFLDEPTTGLDPASRFRVWEIIRSLVADGTTLLLTTQYLDEADNLADRIAVIDHGRVIAEGSPQELKRATGGAALDVALAAPDPRGNGNGTSSAARALAPFLDGPLRASDDGRRLSAPVRSATGLVTAVVRALDTAGVAVDDIRIHEPSLDDVFFALTGHPVDDPTLADGAERTPEPEGALT
jgi:daunorubicin resistance ABC transporter ATP-binding subunit